MHLLRRLRSELAIDSRASCFVQDSAALWWIVRSNHKEDQFFGGVSPRKLWSFREHGAVWFTEINDRLFFIEALFLVHLSCSNRVVLGF